MEEVSNEYIEEAVAKRRYGEVLQLGGLAWGYQTPHRKIKCGLRKILTEPRTWTYSLGKRREVTNIDTECERSV
jgi:hypothetical protein